jgi:hypothetical protein
LGEAGAPDKEVVEADAEKEEEDEEDADKGLDELDVGVAGEFSARNEESISIWERMNDTNWAVTREEDADDEDEEEDDAAEEEGEETYMEARGEEHDEGEE